MKTGDQKTEQLIVEPRTISSGQSIQESTMAVL